jgi:hypothetical protein
LLIICSSIYMSDFSFFLCVHFLSRGFGSTFDTDL